jgi:hypothetical protein
MSGLNASVSQHSAASFRRIRTLHTLGKPLNKTSGSKNMPSVNILSYFHHFQRFTTFFPFISPYFRLFPLLSDG